MPTYNYGRFIGAAIESVLQQTHEDFELLIVDDGSSDETHNVVAGFSDGRIMYQRVTNGGVSRARNVALDRARGEAVSFLDADDLWLPHKLESQIRVLVEQPAVGFVASNFVRFRTEGTELSDQFSFMRRTADLATRHTVNGTYGLLPGNALVALCREGEMPWYPSANMVRRSVANDIRFPVEVRLGEDLHYFNRVWMRTRAALIPAIGIRLRVHDTNSSRGAGASHQQRTINEFKGLLDLDLTGEQISAVQRRIALEWTSVGWSARQAGRYGAAAAAYGEACRTGGATWKMHLTRAIVAGRALYSGSEEK